MEKLKSKREIGYYLGDINTCAKTCPYLSSEKCLYYNSELAIESYSSICFDLIPVFFRCDECLTEDNINLEYAWAHIRKKIAKEAFTKLLNCETESEN